MYAAEDNVVQLLDFQEQKLAPWSHVIKEHAFASLILDSGVLGTAIAFLRENTVQLIRHLAPVGCTGVCHHCFIIKH